MNSAAAGQGSGRPADPLIAVIVLTFNQRERTLRCLENVLQLRGARFEVVLWDNGSDDGTLEAVKVAYPRVLAHRHERNLGVASGRNAAAELAIRRFSPSHLLFLDNDMELEQEFLAGLLEPFTKDPRVGQTQAKLRFSADRQRLNDGGGCRVSFWRGQTLPVGFNEIDRGQCDQQRPCIACGGAMMTRVDVFQELGGFDSKFDPVGPEDLDYSLRLQKAGYLALYCPKAVAYHDVSHTFGGGRYTEVYATHKVRNWIVFLRRHAPWPEQVAFFLISAPYFVARLILREAKAGNFGAIRGLGQGVIEVLRSRGKEEHSGADS